MNNYMNDICFVTPSNRVWKNKCAILKHINILQQKKKTPKKLSLYMGLMKAKNSLASIQIRSVVFFLILTQ